MQDFRKLKVWAKAHQMVLNVYRHSEKFPKEEVYGLTSQLRKASVSIPANIAEGCGKISRKDFSRFLEISLGSTHEVHYYFILSKDLNYLNEDSYSQLEKDISQLKGMLISLIKTVRLFEPDYKQNPKL